MAFVTPLPEEQQNQFAPTGQTTANPMSLLPPQAAQTGGSAGQGGGASSAPGVGTPTQFGSTASKLSDYLQANQDQVQNMANQVAGQIGGQYGSVKSGVDAAAQNFGGQVASGYTPTDPTLLSQVQNNPVQAAQDPNAVSSFQKQLNDQYRGPKSFEGSDLYGTAQKNVNDAMQQAQLLGSYPGLSGYLQNNIETNPTPGQNTLDTVLLQSSQPAYQTVQKAAAPFSGLSDYLASTAAQQDQGVQQAQAAAPAAQQAAQAALGSATGNLASGVNQEEQAALQQVKDYNAAVQAAQKDVANDVPLINALQPIMTKYGASFGGGVTPPWADPTKISIPNQTMALPTAASAASQNDYATLAALNALSGTPVGGMPIDMSTAAQGGTFKAPGAVDRSQLQNAFQQMQQFILGPNGNNINVGSNAPAFATDANAWYNQLINAFGYQYPGSGAYPAPFQVGTNAPPPTGGGRAIPGGV